MGHLGAGPNQSHLEDYADVRDLEAGLDQSHLRDHTDMGDLEAGPDQGLSVGISSLIPIPESLITPEGETPAIVLLEGTIPL